MDTPPPQWQKISLKRGVSNVLKGKSPNFTSLISPLPIPPILPILATLLLLLPKRRLLLGAAHYVCSRGFSNVVLLPFCETVNLICGVVISILWCCKKTTILNNFWRM